MVAPYKVWVRGRSPAVTAGSNPAGGHGYQSFRSCVLSGRGSLSPADHSSRGVLPSVVCVCVCVGNPVLLQRRSWKEIRIRNK